MIHYPVPVAKKRNTILLAKGRSLKSALDEVAEVFEFDGQVDVVDDDLFGNLEDEGSEVEYAGDAGIDEFVGYLLSHGCRHGQDRHAHTSVVHEVLELI